MPVFRIAVLSLALAAPLAAAASFDCAKAASKVEKRVCANPELSRLDDYLNGSYQRATKRVDNKPALRAWQRAWLKSNTLNDCQTDECVKQAYGRRVKLLDDAVKSPWNGEYVRYDQGKPDRDTAGIVLIASGDGSVIGEGEALWMGPNAANGQVNVGQFSATGSVAGASVRFEEGECKLSATLKGAQLAVEDNMQCGGHNVTFHGSYRRK